MSDNTPAGTATDATDLNTENQAAATRTYSQEEVDSMMARMKGSLQKKLLKPYEDLGDPDELRQLRQEAEQRRQEQQLKRGEFDKTLQELAAKKDAEIAKRDNMIREYKVDLPLTSAAAKYRAVNAEQVKALLSTSDKDALAKLEYFNKESPFVSLSALPYNLGRVIKESYMPSNKSRSILGPITVRDGNFIVMVEDFKA
jgi:hypothetical protein